MDITADFINRLYKLGATATDQTYGYINIGSVLAPLNNMGTNVQQPFPRSHFLSGNAYK